MRVSKLLFMRKYVELLYRMTDMTRRDKQKLNEFLDQLDEKYDINSPEDIEKVNNITIENITIENIQDLADIKWENLDFDGIDFDDIDINTEDESEITNDPISDIFSHLEDNDMNVNVDKYKYDPDKSEEQIEIRIDPDISSKKPYIGDKWLEIDNKYMTYFEIDDDLELSNLNIKLKNNKIIINRLNKEISTDDIPENVSNISADLTENNRILLQVW